MKEILRLLGFGRSEPEISLAERERKAATCFVKSPEPERFFTYCVSHEAYEWPEFKPPVPQFYMPDYALSDITVVVNGIAIAYVKRLHLAGNRFIVDQLSTVSSCTRVGVGVGVGSILVTTLRRVAKRRYYHLGVDTLIIDDRTQGQDLLCKALGGEPVPPTMAGRDGPGFAWSFHL